eukprot:4361073-Prymnesium_polylepis.1
MFILRWYKEVDKNEKELSGYQNPACEGYKLMLNNDGAGFCWTMTPQLKSAASCEVCVDRSTCLTSSSIDVAFNRENIDGRAVPSTPANVDEHLKPPVSPVQAARPARPEGAPYGMGSG